MIDVSRFNLVTIENDVDNAAIANGQVYVINAGSNYTSTAVATISGGNGTGATMSLTIVNGEITAGTITAGGTGYTGSPVVAVSDAAHTGDNYANIVISSELDSQGGPINTKYITRKVNLEDGFALVEQFLSGEEASVLVIMDESGYIMLPPSQDHKRASDGDEGPNTGGMGAYAPAPIATPTVLTRVREEIVEPMHHFLRNETIPYRGCLYVGLMIDSNGSPSVVEFNVRLGDPEAQVTIPLIESDLGLLLLASASGEISEMEVEFRPMNSTTVVLASEGYPGEVFTGRKISGWDVQIEEGQVSGFVHLAGANFDSDGLLLSSGGRVLSATGLAPTLEEALEAAYQIIDGIALEGSHYRSDIGFRALSR